jgi:chloramphenicol 3-O phosphotransferase
MGHSRGGDQMRPRFFAGSHRCLPALAAAGNDLIAGHITEVRARREDLARLLEGLGDFLACVRCDLAEIGRRERGRGYRRIGEVCPLSGASGEPGR